MASLARARSAFPYAFLPLLLLSAVPVACANGTSVFGGQGGSGGDTTDTGSGGAPAATTTTTTTTTTSSTAGGGGAGGVGPCVFAADCAGLGDACNVGTCINGVCEKETANDFAACDDGKTCTANDSCQSGMCTGTPKFCPSSDACHIASCDVVADECVEVPGNDGASCVDQNPCTISAFCAGGVCSPGATTDCSFLDGVCSVGTCDPQIGCVAGPKNDGSSCDDGQFCTVLDVCTGGLCQGQPNNCAAPGDVCMIGSCNEATHSCVAVPGNDGAACSDGSACTTGERCSNGSCLGGLPGNAGGTCDDGNACTTGEVCAGGACAGGALIGACVSGDGCCPPGCTLAGDSDCSLTRWSDGTMSWPDQACNPSNSFGFCNTNAQDHADAWATAVCQHNGYSHGVWTGNKAGGCSGDVSMWCQGAIPCNPTYELSCAEFDQTKIEFTCFP